jgi:hypothetical protein
MMVPLTETNRAWFLHGTIAVTIALSIDPLPSPARMPPVLVKAMYSPAAELVLQKPLGGFPRAPERGRRHA